MADDVEVGFEPDGSDEQTTHDIFIGDGEVMIRDLEAFTEQFPFLAAMNRDGQLFLLMPESGGKFVSIEELAKRKVRKLKAAT